MAIRYETIKDDAAPEKPAKVKAVPRPPAEGEAAPPEPEALPFAKPVRPGKKRPGKR